MFKNFKYTFSLDIIWILISAIIAYLFIFYIHTYISKEYFYTLFFCTLLSLIYIRWIVFPSTSFIFDNVFIKVLLWLANFPLILLLLRHFNIYIEAIDDYAINFNPDKQFPLINDLSVHSLLWIKNITLLSFIAALVLIAIMQIRIMWLLMRSIRAKYTKDSGY